MILMIDNYDSFTYNLVQYLGELGADVVVHRNDKITLKEIEQLNPERIVISPGPCTPEKAGISIALSGIISWQMSGKIARSIASFLPSVKSYGLSTVDLAGSIGSVIGAKMDSETLVRFSATDENDNTHTLQGQMMAGHGEVLHGGLVKIVKHDEASDVCFCVPASGSGTPSSSSDSA